MHLLHNQLISCLEPLTKGSTLNQRLKLLRTVKFLCGGGVGVLTYYLTLYTLTEYAKVWYIFSSVAAFAANQSINFVIQKFWTFENRDKNSTPRQFSLYFATAIGMLLANTGFLYLLVEYAHLDYLVAQLILTIVLTFVSFKITREIFSA